MLIIPGSWRVALIVTMLLFMALCALALLLRKRPDHRPRIRVGVDARHGYRPEADERDSLALFRRIMCEQRTRLGI